MLNVIANEIKNKLDFSIKELEQRLNELNTSLLNLEEFKNNVAEVTSNYQTDKKIDFDFLNKCLEFMKEKEIINDDINYEVLYNIRDELKMDFPEKIKDIEKIFDDLMQKLKNYTMQLIVEYQRIKKELYIYGEKIEIYKNLKIVIDKVLNGNLVSEEELNLLDEIKFIYDKPYVELYILAVKNNYIKMNEAILNEKQRIKQEMKSKTKPSTIKKTKRKKELDESKVTDEVIEPKITDDLFDDQLKQLYKKAKTIISSHDLSNKEFLRFINGLDLLEVLDFIGDYGNELDNIALVLNDIILKAVDDGNYTDAKEIISLYLEEYERYEKIEEDQLKQVKENSSQSIEEKLKNIENGNNILNSIIDSEKLINTLESNKDYRFNELYGYIIELKQLIKDIKDLILDDELFDSDLLYEYVNDLNTKYNKLQSELNKINQKKIELDSETDEIDKKVRDFYEGAANIIVFPDNVDFSKQIDDDKRLRFEHKKRVLHGLEDLSKDEEILSSSRHKVKDDNITRYKQLRSYKSPEYRIIYKVSRAEGLERIFKKKMNVIFPIKVGYGATDDKEDLHNDAKNIYDYSEEQIESIIDILNNGTEEEIISLLQTQYSKLGDYIRSCYSQNPNSKREVK